MKLLSGMAVVVDANMLIDYLLRTLVPEPGAGRWTEANVKAAEAVDALIERCCVPHYSPELEHHVETNIGRRFHLPMPGEVLRGLQALKARGKWQARSPSSLSAARIVKAAEKALPTEDRYLLRLAVASSARAIVTHDQRLLDAGRGRAVRTKQGIAILDALHA